MPLEALIAEDEELLRQSLVEQLRRLWPDLKLVAECEDGASALGSWPRSSRTSLSSISACPVSAASRSRARCPS